jgi:hypothetical protein
MNKIEGMKKYMIAIMQLNKFIAQTEPNVFSVKSSCQSKLLEIGNDRRKDFGDCLIDNTEFHEAFLLLKAIFEGGEHDVQKASAMIHKKQGKLIKSLKEATINLKKDAPSEVFL